MTDKPEAVSLPTTGRIGENDTRGEAALQGGIGVGSGGGAGRAIAGAGTGEPGERAGADPYGQGSHAARRASRQALAAARLHGCRRGAGLFRAGASLPGPARE